MDKEKEMVGKPLSIKELKALRVGDWVWVVNNEIPQYTGYYKIDLFAISHLHLVQGLGKTAIPFLTYGDEWVVYRNKEEAESASYGNIENAVQEFAEELKEKLTSFVNGDNEEEVLSKIEACMDLENCIDKLIKERFGGNEN